MVKADLFEHLLTQLCDGTQSHIQEIGDLDAFNIEYSSSMFGKGPMLRLSQLLSWF